MTPKKFFRLKWQSKVAWKLIGKSLWVSVKSHNRICAQRTTDRWKKSPRKFLKATLLLWRPFFFFIHHKNPKLCGDSMREDAICSIYLVLLSIGLSAIKVSKIHTKWVQNVLMPYGAGTFHQYMLKMKLSKLFVMQEKSFSAQLFFCKFKIYYVDEKFTESNIWHQPWKKKLSSTRATKLWAVNILQVFLFPLNRTRWELR